MRKSPALSRTAAVIAALAVVSMAPAPAAGETTGVLDPTLRAIARRSPPDSVLSVIVELGGVEKAAEERARLLALGMDMKEIHRHLIENMKEESAREQDAFLARLQSSRSPGSVHRIRRFWLANLLVMDIEAGDIERVAGTPGVLRVVPNRTVSLGRIGGRASGSPQGTDWNLSRIKAPALWRSGVTGRGVLVCLIDSGVDGTHPALAGKWRGANVPGSYAAWHDPYNFSDFPVDDDENLGPTHGTSVAGILVGSEADDTVGVAPGAQWMAANAFEGAFQTATYEVILDCFEWAADPDGDPGTIWDVPDVINNSWGTNGQGGAGLCEDVLWSAIDALEALGPVLLFSAGNYGPREMSIASPASRIESDVNTMSVGATDDSDGIASFSARGPSPCDGLTAKPEVVAPGVAIRSARGIAAGSGYHYVSGTSFSCPHATGLAALLRQASPTSPASDLKSAILNAASDLGSAGEDNEYGGGIIDAERAAAVLPGASAPFLRLVAVDPSPLSLAPGDTMEVSVRITNLGADASSAQVELADESGLVDVISAISDLGAIASLGEADNSSDPFVLATRSGAPPGSTARLRLRVTTAWGEDEILLTGSVGEATTAGYVDHEASDVIFTVTNFGQYGYFNGAAQIGSGFRFPRGGPNWLFAGFFLAGTGSASVSDGLGGPDTDWRPADGGGIFILRSGGRADEEARALYEDAANPAALPVSVVQRSYAFSDPARGDFIILQYFLRNEGLSGFSGLYAGLYFDWDVDQYSYAGNEVGWVDSLSLGYMYDADFEEHLGIALLEGSLASHRAIDNQGELYDAYGSFSFSDAKKWDFLTAGFEKPVSTSPRDWSHMLSAGPLSVSPGDSAELAFSIVAGMGLEDLVRNAMAAREAWNSFWADPSPTFVISVLPDPIVSEFITLSAVPSESLAGLPVMIVDDDTLTVSPIRTGGLEFYSADYEVKSEGDHRIAVSGFDLTGNGGMSTEWFTASRVGPGEGKSLRTRDGLFAVSLPAGALEFERFVYLVQPRGGLPPLPAGKIAVCGPYSLLPEGLALREPLTVSFRSHGGEGFHASFMVLRLTGNSWSDLETTVVGEEEVTALSSQLGSFILATSGGAPGLPKRYLLAQNFPNPFNPATTIVFDVPEGAGTVRVRLDVFDLRGRHVKTLVDGEESAGRHEVVWDGRDSRGRRAASGLYLCIMAAGDFTQTRKMVLLE